MRPPRDGRGVETLELSLHRPPAPVMQTVNRTFGATHPVSYLAWRKSDDVAQDYHLALLGGQGVKRGPQHMRLVEDRRRR